MELAGSFHLHWNLSLAPGGVVLPSLLSGLDFYNTKATWLISTTGALFSFWLSNWNFKVVEAGANKALVQETSCHHY